MYNLKYINITNKEQLKYYVSDEHIYKYYFGEFELDIFYHSPLREEDSTPSFRISYYNNELKWRDFGISLNPMNAVEFVMYKFNIDYYTALNKIYYDIYLNTDISFQNDSLNNNSIFNQKRKSYSSVSYRTWLYDWEYDYWKLANITKEELQYYKIYGGEIRHNGIIVHNSKIGDPYFIYLFDKEQKIYKGYRPYSPDGALKFYSHNINNHIQGEEYLPKTHDYLIITKSYKDCIVWNKLGYPAIAPHAESIFIDPKKLNDFKLRFKNIYVNFDNDSTGVKQSIKFTTENELCYFNIPLETRTKDPYEFVVKYDYQTLNDLFVKKILYDSNISKEK